MNYVTLSDFLSQAESMINNAILNEEFTTIQTKDGNAVLISEQQYSCLLDTLLRKSQSSRVTR